MADADFDFDKVMGPTAQDQSGNKVLMGGVSNVDPIKAISDGYGAGQQSLKAAYHAVDLMQNNNMPDSQRMSQLAEGGKGLSEKEAPYTGNALNHIAYDAASMAPYMQDQLTQAGAGAVTGAAAGSVVPVIGTAIGADVGGTIGDIHAAWMQSAGQMYSDMRNEGVDHQTAKTIAWTAGSVNAGLNAIGFRALGSVANRALQATEKTAMMKVLSSPMVRQVAQNMAGRTAMNLTLHTAGQALIGGGNAAVEESGNIVAGLIQKHDPTAFTTPAKASEHILNAFKQALEVGAVATAVSHGAGKVGGVVMTEAQKQIQKAKNITGLQNITPAQVRAKVEEHLDIQPNVWEGEPGKVVYGKEGQPLIEAGTKERRQNIDKKLNQARRQTDTQKRIADTTKALGELHSTIKEEWEGSDRRLGVHQDYGGPERRSEGLEAIYPQDENGENEYTRNPVVESRRLNPTEVQARLNQISSDQRLLRTEERRIEQNLKRKEDNGTLTQKDIDKWQKVNDAIGHLDSERDLLEKGFGTTENTGNKTGQQKIKTLAKVFDKLTVTARRLEETKAKVAQAQEYGFNKGSYQTKQTIRKMQATLGQLVNEVTDDPAIRAQARQYINGVTTPAQMEKAIQVIKANVLKQEQKNFENANNADRVKTFQKVQKLIEGKQVQIQGGRPVSKLPIELVNNLQTLKGFLKDKTNITAFHVEFYGKYKDTPSENIPTDDMVKMQLANMAENLHSGDALSRNVTAATVAQWVQDGQKIVEQKRAALKERQVAEQTKARNSVGATGVVPKYHQSGVDKLRQHLNDMDSSQSPLNVLTDNISYGDKNHNLTKMLDESESRHNYVGGVQESTKGLRDHLQSKLDSIGSKTKVEQKNYDDEHTVVHITYTKADGKQTTIPLLRSQMLDSYAASLDETNHPNLREGNKFTLTGDVEKGQSYIERVESAMTPEDHAYIDGHMEFYKDYYDNHINPIYTERNGVNLPQQENYTPRSVVGHEVSAPFTKERLQPEMVMPNSIKSRTNNTHPLQFRNMNQTAMHYIDQMEYYKHYFNLMTTWNNVMADPTFVGHVENSYGKGTMTVMKDFHERFLKNDPTPSVVGNSLWSALKADLSNRVMGARLNQFFTILPHGIATWGHYGDPGGIMKGLAQVAMHPIETQKAISNSPVFKDRLRTGAQVDLKGSLEKSGVFGHTVSWLSGGNINFEFDNPNTNMMIKKMLYAGHIGADATIQYIMGGSIYHAELAKGSTPEQATIAMERAIEQTQPSHSVSQTPYSLTNPITNSLLSQYARHPLQMVGLSKIAIKDWYRDKNNPEAWLTLGGKLASMWAIPGAISAAVSAAPALLPGQQDEDTKRMGVHNTIGGALLGPAAGIPIFGEILQSIWMHAAAPIVGVKDPQNMKVQLHGTLPGQIYEDFSSMLQKWDAQNKPSDPTKIPDFSQLEKQELTKQQKETSKELAESRVVSDVLGAPQAFPNIEHSVPERLKHGDTPGAVMGGLGWSPTALQKRSSDKDNIDFSNPASFQKALKKSLTEGQRPSNLYDSVGNYFNHALQGSPLPQYSTEPDPHVKAHVDAVVKDPF